MPSKHRGRRARKTNVEEERVPFTEDDLRRYRDMARKLFTLADKHKMHMHYEGGRREAARKLVFSYLNLPRETQKDTKK